MKLRIVFMGTPEFSVPALEVIHQRHSVVGVYTQPDRPLGRGLGVQSSAVKRKAIECGLPIFQPNRLADPGEFEKLSLLKADAIVVVAYGQILKKNLLTSPRLGSINIHSSLLPRWRGAAPIQWALLSGDIKTGVTTMRLVEKLDAGEILLQQEMILSNEDTAQTIHDRLAQMGADLILPTLEGLQDGTLEGIPQDESQVTYAHKLTKEMEWLNPEWSAEVLERRVRALNPWPGTSILVGQRLKIKKVKAHLDIQGRKGEIFQKAGMILLGTSQGSLELIGMQWDGKKEVDVSSFINGLRGRGQELPFQVSYPKNLS